jgi:hypothetical protein
MMRAMTNPTSAGVYSSPPLLPVLVQEMDDRYKRLKATKSNNISSSTERGKDWHFDTSTTRQRVNQ